MNRQAQAAVLFLTGVALLRAGVTDLYLRYVKAGLRPLLLAAGVVLIAAAIATVWYELRRPRVSAEPHVSAEPRDTGRAQAATAVQEAELVREVAEPREAKAARETGAARDDGATGEGGPPHSHTHREPRVSWLLVLPLVALILVAPPALGSYTAMRSGTALQPSWGYPDLPTRGTGGSVRLGLADYGGRAAYDHGRSLGHRRITMTGFIALDRGGAPYLVRMVLSCCAADAQPVKIGLTGRIPPVLQPDSWVEITGSYTARRAKDPVNGGVIPYLKVNRVRPVPVPHDPYESWGG
ncbi:TIGR03943 family putative permease subunit [Streptomyces coffeae]|uniref:TIGR03943 family protein n=1 Tax=Streptomyces coffeae TaxID=621382 RepID=A0ABS1NLP6_9ACTN|nr:TIGR03943 family protein [Streptomyces coffeae]MBL1100875.1 TIGR03943 family protein [Streptomyces coffeae]